ncbi:type II toxin-antitoxin system VapC family toxin [Terracidiphilus gabretensis]|uniref:type II toxin-antitoxin system VapC family toxin n=1 Tax=Terracidiphilus gabretensis TaxID=1577687 RepID=UPI000AAA38CF|nr:type II toxin-antitoxin system VapC family toxin [Terracidiphilus gabretensis]
MKAVLDTNILIDYLNGHPAAQQEFARYAHPAISVITWMEVMAGTTPQTEQATRTFLSGFDLLGIDAVTAEQAVSLRRKHRIKLPDAIVWATAQVRQALLVTRNSRDFDPSDPSVRIPYVV